MDYLARIGGEEFVVLLLEAGVPAALVVAERLKQLQYEELRIHKLGAAPISVSIGVAAANNHEFVSELIDRSDQALI